MKKETFIQFKDNGKTITASIFGNVDEKGFIPLFSTQFGGSWIRKYKVGWLKKNIIKKWEE